MTGTVLADSVEATLLVLMVVVVAGPILAARFRFPGILGLIAGGVVVGPFVLGWVSSDGLAEDLGSIGILYLMFLAGVSFDLRAFQHHRSSAITYGLLGFAVPFAISVGVVLSIADLTVLGAALIGAMWASNTLVAYTEVQAAGLQGNRAVSTAVSAGVVADLLSLTVLGAATATATIDADPLSGVIGSQLADLVGDRRIEPTTPDPTLPIWVGLPLLVAFCLLVIPRVSRWAFVRICRSRDQRFVLSLAVMGAGATVALLGGLEGLIGAFLAGLGLNRLIPRRSPLMDRLDFVGSSLFVPIFLVSIGLTIDPALLVDPATVLIGLLFTGFVVVGKTGAALLTGRAFRFGFDEVGLMSSLSFGQAASTLAIAQVGLEIGLFGQEVVNASVLTIVVTAVLTSVGTRFFARRIPVEVPDERPFGQHVLLDIRDEGSDLEQLSAVAAALALDDDGVVVPYAVTDAEGLDTARGELDRVIETLAAQGVDADGLVRVDSSFRDATIDLVREHGASLVVLSWQGPDFPTDFVFGNQIDRIGTRSPVPAVAARVLRPWRRVVVVPGRVGVPWQRADGELAVSCARRLRIESAMPLVVTARTADDAAELGGTEDVEVVVTGDEARAVLDLLQDDDLVIAPAHVLRDLGPIAERRVAARLRNLNVVLVGGPHRLVFSRGGAAVKQRATEVGVAPPGP